MCPGGSIVSGNYFSHRCRVPPLADAAYKQAERGPCDKPKPAPHRFREKHKWRAWHAMGDTPADEARAQYVRHLTRVAPEWEAYVTGGGGKEGGKTPADVTTRRAPPPRNEPAPPDEDEPAPTQTAVMSFGGEAFGAATSEASSRAMEPTSSRTERTQATDAERARAGASSDLFYDAASLERASAVGSASAGTASAKTSGPAAKETDLNQTCKRANFPLTMRRHVDTCLGLVDGAPRPEAPTVAAQQQRIDTLETEVRTLLEEMAWARQRTQTETGHKKATRCVATHGKFMWSGSDDTTIRKVSERAQPHVDGARSS